MARYKLNLQIFAEGGEGGASGAPTADGTNIDSGEQIQDAAGQQESNPKVVYGKQPDDEGEDGQSSADGEGDDIGFEELIKGKYKKDFNERVKGIVEKRMKNVKDHDDALKAQLPIMDFLARKYNIDTSDGIDAGKILEALEGDTSMYEQEAAEMGMDVETYQNFRKVQLENDRFRQSEKQRQEEEANAKRWGEIVQESEKIKDIYPDFDLDEEMENPNYAQMVAMGIDPLVAFQAVHNDEIMAGTVSTIARGVEKKVVNSVKANKKRPVENGISPTNRTVVKSDPTKLSKEDIDEITRQAENGGIITF